LAIKCKCASRCHKMWLWLVIWSIK
jgi:hypothetical protein